MHECRDRRSIPQSGNIQVDTRETFLTFRMYGMLDIMSNTLDKTERIGMTSEEKSTWAVAAVTMLIYGWYFIKILGEAASTPVSEIEYQGLLVAMVGVFIVLLIVSHVVIAAVTAATTGGIEGSDVRDHKIDRFGEYIGGYVLGAGMLVVLVLAMAEAEYFWIANAALGIMVLAELVASATKIILYRRGF
jgi:hypothetical protein